MGITLIDDVLQDILDNKSEIFILRPNTLNKNLEVSPQKQEFYQVYDGLQKKWFSVDNHLEAVENYWKQISDEETANHFIKQFYSHLVRGDDLTNYVNFFITSSTPLSNNLGDYCFMCEGSGYVDCDVCNNDFGTSGGITWCDDCEDSGVIECIDCGVNTNTEFLVGGVLWHNFQTPYTEERNNAAYISSILYFGTYEFNFESESLGQGKLLNQNQVSEDVNSAYIWSELSQITNVKKLTENSKINTSYYGLVENYNDLVNRITNRINTGE